jgi:hypothetical protein
MAVIAEYLRLRAPADQQRRPGEEDSSRVVTNRRSAAIVTGRGHSGGLLAGVRCWAAPCRAGS